MEMSGREGRRPLRNDIQWVQNAVERCIQKYMNKKEAVNTLLVHSNIAPHFTELVWERLEKENPEFFKAYYVKLVVKDQITEFNRLLSEQVELMHQSGLTGITPDGLTSNGSHVLSRQHLSTPGAAQSTRPLTTEDTQPLNVFQNYGSSIQSCGQETSNHFNHSREIGFSPNMLLSQNLNVGFVQTMNRQVVETPGYAGSSPLNISPAGNFLEPHPPLGDAYTLPFNTLESNSQHQHDFHLDWNARWLEQCLPNSNPGFTADFTNTSDLQNGYRPPLPPTDANNFVNPNGDAKRLNPEPANFGYPLFGGD